MRVRHLLFQGTKSQAWNSNNEVYITPRIKRCAHLPPAVPVQLQGWFIFLTEDQTDRSMYLVSVGLPQSRAGLASEQTYDSRRVEAGRGCIPHGTNCQSSDLWWLTAVFLATETVSHTPLTVRGVGVGGVTQWVWHNSPAAGIVDTVFQNSIYP